MMCVLLPFFLPFVLTSILVVLTKYDIEWMEWAPDLKYLSVFPSKHYHIKYWAFQDYLPRGVLSQIFLYYHIIDTSSIEQSRVIISQEGLLFLKWKPGLFQYVSKRFPYEKLLFVPTYVYITCFVHNMKVSERERAHCILKMWYLVLTIWCAYQRSENIQTITCKENILSDSLKSIYRSRYTHRTGQRKSVVELNSDHKRWKMKYYKLSIIEVHDMFIINWKV